MLQIGKTYAFPGCRIVTDPTLVDFVQDWSGVRSKGRARRRRARGFRQRVRILGVPKKEIFSLEGGKVLVMHPEIERQIKQRLASDMAQKLEDATAIALMGMKPIF